MISRHARLRDLTGQSFSIYIAEQRINSEVQIIVLLKPMNREVKFDVYAKRQTANGKLLLSVFSSLYSRIKIFVFAVNSKRHFSIFV